MTFGLFSRRRRNCRNYLVCLACFTMGYSIGLFHIIPPGGLEDTGSSSGRETKIYPWQMQENLIQSQTKKSVIKFKPLAKRDLSNAAVNDSLIKFESSSNLRKVEHIDAKSEPKVPEPQEPPKTPRHFIHATKKPPPAPLVKYKKIVPLKSRRQPPTRRPDTIDHAKNAALVAGNIDATGCPPRLGYAAREEITALFSSPGSGNTWMRHLLQVATGIYTGSVYHDGSLKRRGFLGEGRNDRSVIAVKTHEAGKVHITEFQRAVFVYREPFGAVKAEFNRRHAGHTGVVNPAMLKPKHQSEMLDILQRWRDSNIIWLQNFTGDMHVAQYSRLKTDIKSEMRDVLKFLRYNPSDAQLDCVEKQSIGNFKRTKQFEVPQGFLKQDFYDTMKRYEQDVIKAFDKRKELGLNLSMAPLLS